MNNNFHTFREYMKKDDDELTASMEDYLEMIYRLSIETGYTRINDLSSALNVQPPSVTKMVQKLSELKYINYERYNIITLEEKGEKMGEFLMMRHKLIQGFLKILGITKEAFKITEIIEHSIDEETLQCIQTFVSFIDSRPDILNDYEKFKLNSKND